MFAWWLESKQLWNSVIIYRSISINVFVSLKGHNLELVLRTSCLHLFEIIYDNNDWSVSEIGSIILIYIAVKVDILIYQET